jgi:hypothetical protein
MTKLREASALLLVPGVLALGLIGCSETSNGGGGVGGDGGTGGAPPTGNVTVAHFAPEVPTAMDTTVVVWINNEASSLTVTYGTSTGRQALEAGSYTFGLGTATEELVTLATGVVVEAGDDFVLVAFRDEAAATPPANLPVNLSALRADTNGLDDFNGRVVWLHGADNAALSPVDVINNNACPPPLIAGLVFGADATTDIIIAPLSPSDPYNFGLDITDNDMCDAAVLFRARVAAGVSTVVVPVDEGVDAELAVEVWGLPDPFDMPVRLAPVSDCTGVEDRPDCVVDGSLGLCVFDDCRPFNCSGLEDGTVCGEPPGSGGLPYGWCEDGSCKFAVSDCTGFQDGVVCGFEFVPTAACVDGSCESVTSSCDGSEDGTPCLDSTANYPGTGLCVDGSCEPPQ